MAITRKFLKGMGLTEEQVDTIIEAHTEVVNGLKEQSDSYKADAEKLPEVQKKLDDAIQAAEENGKDTWKAKFEAIKDEFDNYKTEQSEKESKAAKETAYRALLKAAGVNEKVIAKFAGTADLKGFELDETGKFKDTEAVEKSIKTEWADFIGKDGRSGAGMSDPPPSGGDGGVDLGSLSMKDYIAARNKK